MPKIASVQKEEISRVAWNELRAEPEKLKNASAQSRAEIVALKTEPSERSTFLETCVAAVVLILLIGLSAASVIPVVEMLEDADATNAAMRTALDCRGNPDGEGSCTNYPQLGSVNAPKDMGAKEFPGDTGTELNLR